MPDSPTPPVGPVPPVGGPPAVEPVRSEAAPVLPQLGSNTPAARPDVAAVTGGNLASQYAQLVINPDTRDVVIRIRDGSTDEVLSECPSSEIEHLAMYLKQYAEALARRAAQRRGKG